MLLATREENDIKIYKGNISEDYTHIKTFQLPPDSESYFIDIYDTLFYMLKNNLYKISNAMQINAKPINKMMQLNLDNCTAIYYKSGYSLFIIRVYANHCEETEIISLKNDFNFFVNEKEIVFIWHKTSLIIFIDNTMHKATVNFVIKDIKPTTEQKIIIISEEWNIYLYDYILLKIIGGIKAISSKIVAYDSLSTCNMFILCTSSAIYALDVFNKKKTAEIQFSGISSIKLYSQDILIIHSDKIYEFNLKTNESRKITQSNVRSFIICNSNEAFGYKESINKPELNMSDIMQKNDNISYIDEEEIHNGILIDNNITDNERINEIIETKILNLKSEVFKVFFRIQDELDALKERVSNLEKKIDKN